MKIEEKLERREFLKKAGIFIGAGVCLSGTATLLSSCEQDEDPIPAPPPSVVEVLIANQPALAVIGGTVKVLFPGKNNNAPIVITRISETEFSALDSICPHALCEVDLAKQGSNEMPCPCHLVFFSNVDGSITKNPIQSTWSGESLKKFEVEYESSTNKLKITV